MTRNPFLKYIVYVIYFNPRDSLININIAVQKGKKKQQPMDQVHLKDLHSNCTYSELGLIWNLGLEFLIPMLI